MASYTTKYKFQKKEVIPIPTTNDVTSITDERFKVDIETYAIIKEFKLRPEAIPVLSIPLVYDDLTKSFKITKYARIESVLMGYYYATEPTPLTTTTQDYLRIDDRRFLLTRTKSYPELLIDTNLSYDNSGGSETVDYQVFDSDVVINESAKYILQFYLNTSTKVKLNVNGNTAYLNSGVELSQNSWYEFEMQLLENDAINVIVEVPAGVNLSGYLRIFYS